jgi:Flp pilus assembly protein TadB
MGEDARWEYDWAMARRQNKVDEWARQSPNHGAIVSAVGIAVVWFLGGLVFYRHQSLWRDLAVALAVGVLTWALGLWLRTRIKRRG